MINSEIKRAKLIETVCLYGNEVVPGSRFDTVLLKDIGPYTPAGDVEYVYCHAVTPNNKLLVSDMKQRLFFLISGGWGTIGKTLCGLECTDFYDFKKDNVTPFDVKNEISQLENRLDKKNGFASTMTLSHKIEFLKLIEDSIG